MNIIKGIDRIALVIAILAMLAAFPMGFILTKEQLTTFTPEYAKWHSQFSISAMDLFDNLDGSNKASNRAKIKPPPAPYPKYQYPAMWELIGGGILSSILAFTVIFFGIKGTTRGIRRLYMWIIGGFGENGKPMKIEEKMNWIQKTLDFVCFIIGPVVMAVSLFDFNPRRHSGYYSGEDLFGIAFGVALICIGLLRKHWRKSETDNG